MSTRNLTSIVSVVLTVALVWSSLGAGLLSAPARGSSDAFIAEDSVIGAEGLSGADMPASGIQKPNPDYGALGDERNRPNSQGGWSYEPGTAPWGDWSYRDAHNVNEVSALGYSGTGVTVAVADTGIDFASKNLEGKYMVVDNPASPYHGWPVALDAHGLPQYLITKEATHGAGGIANTSLHGVGPFDIDHTIKVDGQKDFLRNELVATDTAVGDIKTPDTFSGNEFDLSELWTTRDADFWYMGIRTNYAAVNRTFGFAIDFDGPASGSIEDPHGNYLDFEASHSSAIEQVSYHATKNLVATCAAGGSGTALTSGYEENSVKIWGPDGNLVHTLPFEQHPVTSIVWSPNGQLLAYQTSQDVVVYETAGWTEARRITHSTNGPNFREAMAFSPNGTMLIVGSLQSAGFMSINVQNWQNATLALSAAPRTVVYSPDGSMIAFGLSNGRIHIVDSADYAEVMNFVAPGLVGDDTTAIETLAWNTDSTKIATGRNAKGAIDIWDLASSNNRLVWGGSNNGIFNVQLSGSPYVDQMYFNAIPDEVTVNGLTAYNLTTSAGGDVALSPPMGPGGTHYWGMRAWVRDVAGTETELTPGFAVAIVSRSVDGMGDQGTTWPAPATALDPTDSIVVRIYQGRDEPVPTTLVATFASQQLGATYLNATTWEVNYITMRSSALGAIETRLAGHGVTSTVNLVRWTGANMITCANDGRVIYRNPTTFAVANTRDSRYNSPVLSFAFDASGAMFVGTADCTLRKYPATWADYTPFVAHKPDIMIYIPYEREYYKWEGGVLKLDIEDEIQDPIVYKWTGTNWYQTNLTNIFGKAFYKGSSAGEWTQWGFIEMALPRNFTANPDQNDLYINSFICADFPSRPQDTVPQDCNVPTAAGTEVDWVGTHATTLSAWGYQNIPKVTIDHTDIGSKGTCHFGYHPSMALTNLYGSLVPMVVIESAVTGTWDKVYVDMNQDYIIDLNDPWVNKQNPVLGYDIWDRDNPSIIPGEFTDGAFDISGGLLYFIGDGVNPLPYSERMGELMIISGEMLEVFSDDNPLPIPGKGEIVAFYGDMDYNDLEDRMHSHGTQMASAIAGDGFTRGEYGPVAGVSPNITFLPICNAHYALDYALYFAVEGYDGRMNTGDEAQIVSVGQYNTGYGNGFDDTSYLVEYLVNATGSKAVFISPAGDDGSGYGTVASPCGMNTLVVGFAEDNSFVSSGGNVHHQGAVSELSSRGPTAAGISKPDIIALGVGSVELPLGASGSMLTSGGSMSQTVNWMSSDLATAVTTGVMALIFEAYKDEHGSFPSTQLAMDIMRSSAKDLGYDALTQGAGFVDALAAVKVAQGDSGLTLSASKTSFGTTFGADYKSFINVLAPGDGDTLPITVRNPTGSGQSADYGFEHMAMIDLQEYYQVVPTTGGYSGDISGMIPADAEVVKVSAQTNYSWLVPWMNGTGYDYKEFTSESGSFSMKLWDWVDAQAIGETGHGVIDDADDLSYLAGTEYGGVNSLICTLSNPHGRLAGKLALQITQMDGNMQNSMWKISIESYAATPTAWFSLSKSASGTIAAGGTDTVNVNVNVPADAYPGTYGGSFVAAYAPTGDTATQQYLPTALPEAEYLNTNLYSTYWDDGMEGNYWDNWTSPDANFDGIVDLPYEFNTPGKRDNYPLVNPVIAYSGAITSRGPITIASNGDFTEANGVVNWATGDGSVGNPWLIENFIIDGGSTPAAISISDTDHYFLIRNCEMFTASAGISISNVQNGQLQGNEIHDVDDAIDISSCDKIIVTDNNIHDASVIGIYLDSSVNIQILGNQFDNTFYGLYAEWTDDCVIAYNEIVNTTDGVIILDSCVGNIIHHNDFLDLGAYAYCDGTNFWDDGAEGNYWNGVPSGAPYAIDGNTDNYPLDAPVYAPGAYYEPSGPITIVGDADFLTSPGVINPGAAGTAEDPYIISGWSIDTTGQTHGIWVQDTNAYFVIMDCVVSGTGVCGIMLNSANNGTVRCVDMTSAEGITVQTTSEFFVAHNDLQVTGTGIDVLGSDTGFIAGNTIMGGDYGIHLFNTRDCNVEYNQVDASAQAGLWIHDSSTINVMENVFTNCPVDGVLLETSGDCTLTLNTLVTNGYGIHLANATDFNLIHHNNLLGNTVQAYDDFPGDTLATFELFDVADASTYDVWFCNITKNGVPLIIGSDYAVDLDTGLVTFTPTLSGESGGAEIIIMAVLLYEEDVPQIIKLPNTRLTDAAVTVTVSVTKLNGTVENVPVTYDLHRKVGIIVLDDLVRIEKGVTVSVNYQYYSQVGIVPITLNVLAAEIADFTFGDKDATETPNIMPVWGVRAGQGNSLASGDRRYFYARVPNQGMFSISQIANFYLYTELEWLLNQTDVNVVIYGKGEAPISDQVAPYTMKKLGGSEEKADFTPFTVTGGPKDILMTSFNHEILTICVSSKSFNGSGDSITKFEGRSGWLRLSDNAPKTWTDSLVGSMDVSFHSSVELSGVYASIVGPAQGTKTTEEIYQDDLSLYDLSTLEGWLTMNAVAGFTKVFTVENALSWDVRIIGDATCPDLDLAVFLDGHNGQPKDGVAQWQEIITQDDIKFDAYGDNYGSGKYAYSADADADEAIKFIAPPDGDYIVKVLGYTVTAAPGHFDLEVKTIFAGVEGYKLAHMNTEYEDEDELSGDYLNQTNVNPFDVRTFKIQWAFPEDTKDDAYGGIFVLGVPESRKLIVLSIDIVLDREAPVVLPSSPTPGAVISDNRPTITAKLEDLSRGELDPNGVTVKLDGADITGIASIAITETLNSAGLSGYWLGDVKYQPLGPLSDGGHVLSVEAKDKTGNTHVATWGFTVDTMSPGLKLDDADDIIYTNDPNYPLSGSTESNAAISILGVSGTVDQRIDNTFTVTLQLQEGQNSLTVRSRDPAGNVREAYKTVILDTQVPAFVRTVALDGSTTNKRTTGIYGELSEPGTLYINDAPVPVNSDGIFRYELVQLIEGANQQNLVFTDRAGNTVTNTITITLDTAAPSLFLNPVNRTVTTRNLVISGITEPDVTSLTVNGYNADKEASGAFNYDVTLSYGINTIVVQSKDRAGNLAQEVVTVNYMAEVTGGTTPVAEEPLATNWAAIGVMVALLVVGLILGLFLGPMILGGKKEEMPEEETPAEGEVTPEGDEAEEPSEPSEEIPPEESIPEELPESEEMAPEGEEAVPEATEELPAEAEAAPEGEELAEEPPAEPEAVTEEPEDPKIAKLRQAYESGKISKELYEKNLAKFKGQ